MALSFAALSKTSGPSPHAVQPVRVKCQSQAAHTSSLGTNARALAVGTVLSLAGQRRLRSRRKHRTQRCSKFSCYTEETLQLLKLGSTSFEKALEVNLDATFYGSFAEIGAGQEVSRTFLTAGAAAGTVARSLSAYDMQMSDVTYGKAARYVTKERLGQMLQKEYDTLEECLRSTKGQDTRFFAFASTLAAKAYMSNRECEGWVGLKYQASPGAPTSEVHLHVRMSDPSAPEQGEAIGVLGTNLVYLCNFASDPYIIVSFLLDGLEQGRLEVDFVELTGPQFPEGSVDSRLMAMRMVQFRIAESVLLEFDPTTGHYNQSVPNTALYKRSLVVQRSRYRPVTYMHFEVIQAAARMLVDQLGETAKPPLKILELQIDDITRPRGLVRTEGRISRAKKMIQADKNEDGFLSQAELLDLTAGRLPADEVNKLIEEIDLEGTGKVAIDMLAGLSRHSILVDEYLDRFRMLAPLKFPVLVSGIRRTHKLSEYLARYTREMIALTVGGGNYSIERGLFNEEAYTDEKGGMLEAFGQLFSGNVRIFQYPNINPDGSVTDVKFSNPTARYLHQYLVAQGKIQLIPTQHISPEALDTSKNEFLRGQSEDVIRLIQGQSDEWEKYVPTEVAASVKKRKWYSRLTSGQGVATVAYKILNEL